MVFIAFVNEIHLINGRESESGILSEESFIFCCVNVPFVTNLLVAVVSQSTSSMVGLTVQGEKVCF